ncbi:alpha/beta hydrolase [Anaeropeptidivorans aminofermentans]|uniref:alpha/beta hydrolase n=1 Tax=Anaeropeptidivorans aminofermentans TaxID=2934315 RepID=UPI002024B529|nr:alpha/beta hydrolase [Anaeropeptidivorans aminofermentans]
MYRKYFEPEYAEVSPEVNIPEPQMVDLENAGIWRARANLETVTELTELIKRCNIYEPIMKIPTTNIHMERNGALIPLRLYHPEGEGPFPVMVFYHGGGWTMNNLDVYDYVPRYFAKYGKIAVVSVDYRLAPENKFPAGFDDCYEALLWTVQNKELLNADLDKLSLCGDSAGGNLAAAVALKARDAKGPKIDSQILIYPATTFIMKERSKSELRYGNGGYFLNMNSDEGMCHHYFSDLADRQNPYASPLLAENHENLPRALFISAECDPLLDQALMYAAKLEDSGNKVEFKLYQGMIHAFINRTYQKTFEALDEICRFAGL